MLQNRPSIALGALTSRLVRPGASVSADWNTGGFANMTAYIDVIGLETGLCATWWAHSTHLCSSYGRTSFSPFV
jgi:hypothetical protein